jgi:hypothetical protein
MIFGKHFADGGGKIRRENERNAQIEEVGL